MRSNIFGSCNTRRDISRNAYLAKMDKIPSAVVMIRARFVNGKTGNYVIVDDCLDENIADDVLYYTHEDARELLTAAFAWQRERSGRDNVLHGNNYEVTEYIVNSFREEDMNYRICPAFVHILHGKRAYMQAEDEFYALLYSPVTGRYELLRAFYSEEDECLCVSDVYYRKFLGLYGSPYWDSGSEDGDWNMFSFEELPEQSILSLYGYTVNSRDNLPDERRREILMYIVDHRILTVAQIIKHIDFCIRTHSGFRNQLLRRKWREDQSFIAGYQINPRKFRIAGEIRR